MKPHLLKVSTAPAHSFSIRQDITPLMNGKWHYHPEIELVHFKKGNGKQFIGDSIKPFNDGDVILVGANLPHYWRFDDSYITGDTSDTADVRVAHFSQNFWGEHFLLLPENRNIKQLIDMAARGIMINGEAKTAVAKLMDRMLKAEGAARIILLMEILVTIADCKRIDVLSSIGFRQDDADLDNARINDVYEYSLANLKKRITLDEIASVARVSPNSFCRYFKSHANKTYSQFLIELKVGMACRLLINDKLNIKQICCESGFHNFASFHKYFKQITGKSPLIYQKEFIEKV